MVIRSKSLFDLIFSSDLAHHLFSLTKDWMLCFDNVIRAISVPEKNAEIATKIKNRDIDRGSTERE